MESDPIYGRYVSARVTIYRQLDSLRAEVDAWLRDRASCLPSMAELAQLEALHSERQRLLTALQDAEERFLDHVVSLLSDASRADGSH
jgi:hypothetical protein